MVLQESDGKFIYYFYEVDAMGGGLRLCRLNVLFSM